jgi:hypothetical protein
VPNDRRHRPWGRVRRAGFVVRRFLRRGSPHRLDSYRTLGGNPSPNSKAICGTLRDGETLGAALAGQLGPRLAHHYRLAWTPLTSGIRLEVLCSRENRRYSPFAASTDFPQRSGRWSSRAVESRLDNQGQGRSSGFCGHSAPARHLDDLPPPCNPRHGAFAGGRLGGAFPSVYRGFRSIPRPLCGSVKMARTFVSDRASRAGTTTW